MKSQRSKRRRALPASITAILLVLSNNVGCIYSFILQLPTRTVPTIKRDYDEYCQDTPVVQCWNLPRLTAETKLHSSLENEVDSRTITESSNQADINGSGSNGVILSNGVNGSNGMTSNGAVNGSGPSINPSLLSNVDQMDVPMPTENGGYTHTAASRAKIGAANKGKTPWNKGKARSEEVKARIAAGVRKRNRERFLQKLKDMGVTEEEYEAKKKEERRKKEAERRARRTEKGGYRPTDETKAKISKVLKEKYASGEIKRRQVDPSKVRRGFKQSAETRAKISASLKKRWADDENYRDRMKVTLKKANTKDEVRKKISESLKAKWKDPEFRAEMMEKMATRQNGLRYDESHREKISRAMKEKWQDPEYREKTVKSIQQNQAERKRNRPPTPVKKKTPKSAVKGSAKDSIQLMQPRKVGDPGAKKKRARKKKIRILDGDEKPRAVKAKPKAKKSAAKKAKAKKKKKEPDGSVNRLREERRDLFDLLYGDENFENDDEDDEDEPPARSVASMYALEDEDLDSFDPYGLDDY